MQLIKTIQYILSAVSLIFLLVTCTDSETQSESRSLKNEHRDEEETNEVTLTGLQFETAGIAFGQVERKQISGTFRANGVLDVPPRQKVSISIPMGGFLKSTNLLEGKKVKKGELIAVIENPEYIQMQQDYLDAKSQLEYASSDYERQQELSKENINALKTLQKARATYQSLLARVNGLKEKIKVSGINLRHTDNGNIQSHVNIYSPINGFVTEINANLGKFVNPSDVLFEIVDTEHLHAELTVFEKDVPKLQIGQKVRFTLANETTERTARVYLIGKEISNDRTARIHCHIEKEDIHLLPGMYLKAVVEAGGVQVPALPDEAFVDYESQKYIFIALPEEKTAADTTANSNESEHHFKMVQVQTGNSDDGYTELKTAEDTGNARVVIKGAYALLSKMKNSEEGGH